MNPHIAVIKEGGHPDCEYIREKLYEYNARHVPVNFEHLNLVMKDENGEKIGGLLSIRYWDCLFIDVLWIDPEHRGAGYGKKLLDRIEQIARIRGVRTIHLDTYDFQAPAFYEKHGFTCFGKLEDAPQGHVRYYLKKVLAQ